MKTRQRLRSSAARPVTRQNARAAQATIARQPKTTASHCFEPSRPRGGASSRRREDAPDVPPASPKMGDWAKLMRQRLDAQRIVMGFGGSSIRDAERVTHVADLIASKIREASLW